MNISFFKKNSHYIIAVLFAVLGVLYLGVHIAMPTWLFPLLGAFGLGAFRLAITDISGNKGWKAYTASVLTAVLAVLQAEHVDIPYSTVYAVLGALGFVGVSHAVDKLVKLLASGE